MTMNPHEPGSRDYYQWIIQSGIIPANLVKHGEGYDEFRAALADKEIDDEPAVSRADLILQSGAYQFRFVVLVNMLDSVPQEPMVSRGAITLGLLDMLPREPGIYNRLRRALQGFVDSAAFGNLLMSDSLSRFAGIEITTRLNSGQFPANVHVVVKVQYMANKPMSRAEFNQDERGVWLEVDNDNL